MHRCPSSKYVEHHIVCPCEKEEYKKVKWPAETNAQNLRKKTCKEEIHILDCFQPKRMHRCPSVKYGEQQIVCPCQKEEYKEDKWTAKRNAQNLCRKTCKQEIHILDRVETKRTHPCPSLKCQEHQFVWPRQKEEHHEVKGPADTNSQNMHEKCV